jgi:hypothetical protein
MRMQLLCSFGFFALVSLISAPVQALSVTFTRDFEYGIGSVDGDSANLMEPSYYADPLLGEIAGWSFSYEGSLASSLEVFDVALDEPTAPVGVGFATSNVLSLQFFGFPGSYAEISLLSASCSGVGSCGDLDSETKPFALGTGLQTSPLPDFAVLGFSIQGESGQGFPHTGTNGLLVELRAIGVATLTIEYVPEPGTALLLALGIGAVATRRRAIA